MIRIRKVIRDYGGILQNAGCTLSFGGLKLGPSIALAIEEVLPQVNFIEINLSKSMLKFVENYVIYQVTKVRELILYDNKLGNEGAIAIARALQSNSTVTSVNLVNERI